MHRFPHAQRAFTLIELIVVVIVLGILMAIAIPSFLGAQKGATDAASKANVMLAYKAAKLAVAGDFTAMNKGVADIAIANSEPELLVSPNIVDVEPATTDVAGVSDILTFQNGNVTGTLHADGTFTFGAAAPTQPSVAPVNTSLPVIHGTMTVWETPYVSDGDWSGSTGVVGYDWQRCDTDGNNCVSTGTGGSSYTLSAADVGKTLRAVVTAGGSGDGSATATAISGPSDVVQDHIPLTALLNVRSSSMSDQGACAVLDSGAVRCWGNDSNGQLGNGSPNDGSVVQTSVAVSGISTATAVAQGSGKGACAVLSDGTVECWGGNYAGQLGDGTTADSSTPVVVSGISTATAVRTGYGYACALLSDGTVKCWGDNYAGQLGDGTTTSSLTPVTVSGISTATAIGGGYANACALLADGTVSCWGNNWAGQLGDGTTVEHHSPVMVAGISNATALSSGTNESCALLADGTLKCWGANFTGVLGDGTTLNSSTPVTVSGVSAVSAISVGSSGSGFDSACALLNDGTVTCWGQINFQMPPLVVSGLSDATTISVGGASACAVLTSGKLACWGGNGFGQLGNGTIDDSTTPVFATKPA